VGNPPMEKSVNDVHCIVVRWQRMPGEGGAPVHGLYRYVRPERVRFFSRFGHK